MDRTGNSLLPAVVKNQHRWIDLHGCANDFEVGAKHSNNRRCARLRSQADGAFKQKLTVKLKELFGLAQAATGPGGEDDGRDRHRHECSGSFLTTGRGTGKIEKPEEQS